MGDRKSFNIPGHFHELTFSTYNRVQIFRNPRCCEAFMARLVEAKHRHNFELNAYVLMPDHVHLLIRPIAELYEISKVLHSLKLRTAISIREVLERAQSPVLDRIKVVRQSRAHYRIWEAGGGYDRNLFERDSLVNSVNYIHTNPIRRSLCELATEWDWSSAGDYELGKSELVDFINFH